MNNEWMARRETQLFFSMKIKTRIKRKPHVKKRETKSRGPNKSHFLHADKFTAIFGN